MNQPTREEFEQLKEEVRKLKEQQTEPIKITRLEIDTGSMHKKLDKVEENTNITKIQMEGARADIRVIKANQSDLRGYIEGQFKDVKEDQNAHKELMGELINFAESHDALLKNTATKNDVAAIKGDISRLEGIMMQILNRLPRNEGE